MITPLGWRSASSRVPWLLALLGERGRVLQGEAHDVDVAAAGALGREGDGGVGLGGRGELGGQRAQRLDDAVQGGAGGGGLRLVDADVEHEAAGLGALGHGADAGGGRSADGAERALGGVGDARSRPAGRDRDGAGRDVGQRRRGADGGGADGSECERHDGILVLRKVRRWTPEIGGVDANGRSAGRTRVSGFSGVGPIGMRIGCGTRRRVRGQRHIRQHMAARAGIIMPVVLRASGRSGCVRCRSWGRVKPIRRACVNSVTCG